MIWSEGDKKLFSCGEDGLIYVYTTDSWEKKDIKLTTPNIILKTILYNKLQVNSWFKVLTILSMVDTFRL